MSLKLGLTSFGGPVAHLGYFREFLERYAMNDLSALSRTLQPFETPSYYERFLLEPCRHECGLRFASQ